MLCFFLGHILSPKKDNWKFLPYVYEEKVKKYNLLRKSLSMHMQTCIFIVKELLLITCRGGASECIGQEYKYAFHIFIPVKWLLEFGAATQQKKIIK